jgi:hypothetical protein
MRQSKLFIGRSTDKLSRDLMSLDGKQCRMVTGLLIGHCTLRGHHITGLSESRAGSVQQEEESLYHILCQCPALAGHRLAIFSSA